MAKYTLRANLTPWAIIKYDDEYMVEAGLSNCRFGRSARLIGNVDIITRVSSHNIYTPIHTHMGVGLLLLLMLGWTKGCAAKMTEAFILIGKLVVVFVYVRWGIASYTFVEKIRFSYFLVYE